MNDRIFVLVILCQLKKYYKRTILYVEYEKIVNKKGNKILNEPHVLTSKSRVSYILKFVYVVCVYVGMYAYVQKA